MKYVIINKDKQYYRYDGGVKWGTFDLCDKFSRDIEASTEIKFLGLKECRVEGIEQ